MTRMRIGITYDLKGEVLLCPDAPDDLQEEFDSPVTIEAIARVLRDLGHDVVLSPLRSSLKGNEPQRGGTAEK